MISLEMGEFGEGRRYTSPQFWLLSHRMCIMY